MFLTGAPLRRRKNNLNLPKKPLRRKNGAGAGEAGRKGRGTTCLRSIRDAKETESSGKAAEVIATDKEVGFSTKRKGAALCSAPTGGGKRTADAGPRRINGNNSGRDRDQRFHIRQTKTEM